MGTQQRQNAALIDKFGEGLICPSSLIFVALQCKVRLS